jgi:hypothetical protein
MPLVLQRSRFAQILLRESGGLGSRHCELLEDAIRSAIFGFDGTSISGLARSTCRPRRQRPGRDQKAGLPGGWGSLALRAPLAGPPGEARKHATKVVASLARGWATFY